MPKFRMPTSSLKQVINPLDGVTWKVRPIDPIEVREAVQRGEGITVPWQEAQQKGLPPEAESQRLFHVQRVAYLVKNPPIEGDTHKIFLAVSKERVWFNDGNHRIAAAIVREDPFVELYIADSGELELSTLFPGLESVERQD